MSFIDEIKNCFSCFGGERIVIFNDNGAYFEGVLEILTLEKEIIELKTKRNVIKLIGKNFSIGKYFQNDVSVLGKIEKVEFV